MKNCPYCAEQIQSEAVKCKHCGEWLQTPPASTVGTVPEVWSVPAAGRQESAPLSKPELPLPPSQALLVAAVLTIVLGMGSYKLVSCVC